MRAIAQHVLEAGNWLINEFVTHRREASCLIWCAHDMIQFEFDSSENLAWRWRLEKVTPKTVSASRSVYSGNAVQSDRFLPLAVELDLEDCTCYDADLGFLFVRHLHRQH